MPTFKIDDREIPFEPGDTIIRAAHRAGIDIPHYCWHPGLSIAANCRMCLVEVGPPPGRPPMMLQVLRWDPDKQDYIEDKKPKLQPACQMQAVEGMEVKSESSEHVAQARSAVQEMLLLNHPVDCPICDQSGECRLQDYWLEHQADHKKMLDEPVHKPKAVVFGPTIVYDAERCIVCTRCIRVCDELAKDSVLSLRERGNLAEVVLAPGRELDHPYTLMTEYVCPVGALTARDFRFKARVWFLRSARTVCQGCATGCNAFLDYDPRHQKVYRHRPRENQAVNQYWMCDEGMLDYRRVHENRALSAKVGGKRAAIGAALDKAAALLEKAKPGELAAVLSAQHSLEDNFALLALARDHLGVKNIYYSGKPQGGGDDILRHVDKNPNTEGVKALVGGRLPAGIEQLAKDVAARKIKTVLALGSDIGGLDDASSLGKAEALIVVAPHQGPLAKKATVVLPATTWAECDGVFVNAKQMGQESEQAVAPQGEARPGWKLVAALGVRLGHPTAWRRIAEVRKAMSSAEGKPPPGAARQAALPAGASQ